MKTTAPNQAPSTSQRRSHTHKHSAFKPAAPEGASYADIRSRSSVLSQSTRREGPRKEVYLATKAPPHPGCSPSYPRTCTGRTGLCLPNLIPPTPGRAERPFHILGCRQCGQCHHPSRAGEGTARGNSKSGASGPEPIALWCFCSRCPTAIPDT